MKKLVVILLYLFSVNALSYVISKTESGSSIRWDSSSKKIPIYYNPVPVNDNIRLDIEDASLLSLGSTKKEYLTQKTEDIIKKSVEQWNSVSSYEIQPVKDLSLKPVGGLHPTIRYTDDHSYFGSGVIAVTSIYYNPDGGKISSADILINQSSRNVINLTVDESVSSLESAFIGDVLTHELGHFFGLSHSEVINSSMVYSIFKGQSSVHSDDSSGILKLYNEKKKDGEISGSVIVGSSTLSVFGVNVNLISLESNQVVQAQIADENGKFSFDNLDLNESYYVSVSPVKAVETISEYYKNINNQLCFQEDFSTSFFSKCGPRNKSRPQLFYLDDTKKSIDLGGITIRCDENLNTEYYSKKFEETNRSFELLENYQESNLVFHGLFSKTEIIQGTSGKGDEFTIDLRNLNTNSISLDNYLVKLNLSAIAFGSGYGLKAYTKLVNEGSWREHEIQVDNTGKKLGDLSFNVPLSSDASENLIELKVFPVQLTSVEQYEIFASPAVLLNDNNVYTITAQVGQFIGSKFSALAPADSYPYDDNWHCPEGNLTYPTSPYISMSSDLSNALQMDDEGALAISCATVDLDGGSGPSGGMGSFILGIAMMLLMFNLNKITFNSLSDS